MTNLVSATKQAGPTSMAEIANVPALRPDASQAELVRQFSPRMEGARAVIERAVTSVERQILQRRNFDLTKALRPISESRDETALVKAMLAQFFKGYPSLLNQDGGSLVGAYMVDLEPMPLFAIARALFDIKQGRVKIRDQKSGREMDMDPDWPPASARVAEIARRHVTDPAKEQRDISRVLNAARIEAPAVTDPVRRKEIGDMLKGLADTLRASDAEREASFRSRQINGGKT